MNLTTTEPPKTYETRNYQQEIIKRCIEQNSIVYLPTGAGKTYIAIQVIKHFSRDLEKKYSDGGMRSVFMTNTVALAKQQCATIQSHTHMSVELLIGEKNIDHWSLEDWMNVLENNEILVATADVIADAIYHRFIDIRQVNLMVFDECHHGRKEHAYARIMKDMDAKSKTRIVGLSGMLIGMDSKIKAINVKEELNDLEAMFMSTIVAVDSAKDLQHVLKCSTDAKEAFARYRRPETNFVIKQVKAKLATAQNTLDSPHFKKYSAMNPKTLRETDSKKLKSLKAMVEDFAYHADELGPFAGYLSLLSSLIQLEIKKRFSETNEYREIVKMFITKFEESIKFMKTEMNLYEHNMELIKGTSAEKIKKLLEVLVDKFTDPNRKKDLQAIVFVKRRMTAKIIYHMLKAIKTSNSSFPVVADFVVGVNDELPESIENIVNASFTNLAIEKFKNKESNCIISTSVLDEGIDLQMCNLVILFDKPDTPRAYVQSRGRARVDQSDYIVLVEETEVVKFQKKIVDWRDVHNELNRQLVCKSYDRELPTEESIEEQRTDLWEPYITPKSKSKLCSSNSVTTLENYSSKLPKDLFTSSNLTWSRKDVDGTVIAGVKISGDCKMKSEIFSAPKENVRIAKKHAAFKACIELFKVGELNDHLVPVDPENKVEEFKSDYFEHWSDYPNDKPNAGTRKNKRIHDIKKPDVWKNSNPRVDKSNFLHVIKVRPLFEPANNYADVVFKELLENKNTFGILTSNRLPKMCNIPLFLSCGQIEVEICTPPIQMRINTEEEMKKLKSFHVSIFQNMLGTWGNFMAFDNSSFVLVPLSDYCNINWDLVNVGQNMEQPKCMSYDEIKRNDFSVKAYDRMTICPFYRFGCEDPYIVIEVDEGQTPSSPFPSEGFVDYRHYFKVKHDISISNTQQYLLEVKGVGKELSLFFPGGGYTGKKKSYERSYREEFFVPELCHNYKIPGDYWMKARLIPSILHRINYLLLAEELIRWLKDRKVGATCFKEQKLRVDVDYNDFDKREQIIANELNEEDMKVDREMIQKFLKFIREEYETKWRVRLPAAQAKALLWFEKSKLPVDIDRNWLTLQELDIDMYYRFMSENREYSKKLVNRKLIQSPSRQQMALTDAPDRETIKILDLCEIDGCLQQKDVIKVITTANAGDVYDMEVHEVLGDAFLKFSVSLYLYKRHPDLHEGYLTSLKGKIVSNRNLFYIGNQIGLSTMIKSSKYDARYSFPPSAKLPDQLNEYLTDHRNLLSHLTNLQKPTRNDTLVGKDDAMLKELKSIQKDAYGDSSDNTDYIVFQNKHSVGDKIVADSVEALIGVVIGSLGIESGLNTLKALKILPDDQSIKNLLTEQIQPRNVYEDESRIPFIGKLQKIIGYEFKNPVYLIQAVTHPSCAIKTFGTYQQLEFVGDAVLDFLITCYIYEQCPGMTPGDLTDLRSALVNNATLACIIVRKNIHQFLQFENIKLTEVIDKFVEFQKKNEDKVVFDQIALMETEDENCVADAVDIPKVLGDILEAIIGAIYFDSGMDLKLTWSVIHHLMKSVLHDFMANVPKQIVRQLYEYDRGSAEPRFTEPVFLEEYGQHAVGVEIFINNENMIKEQKTFIGIGKNRALAKKCAAKLAVRALTTKP